MNRNFLSSTQETELNVILNRNFCITWSHLNTIAVTARNITPAEANSIKVRLKELKSIHMALALIRFRNPKRITHWDKCDALDQISGVTPKVAH